MNGRKGRKGREGMRECVLVLGRRWNGGGFGPPGVLKVVGSGADPRFCHLCEMGFKLGQLVNSLMG